MSNCGTLGCGTPLPNRAHDQDAVRLGSDPKRVLHNGVANSSTRWARDCAGRLPTNNGLGPVLSVGSRTQKAECNS